MEGPAAQPIDLTRTPFAVVDLETTGFSPRLHDRILEISIVRLRPDGTIEDEYVTLVDAGRDVGPVHRHGITASEIAGAPKFRELVADIAERLDGAVLVAHNARFDREFLVAEFAWSNERFPDVPTLCTLHLSWVLYPLLGHHRLADCCGQAKVAMGEAHTALDDARAAALLLAAYLAEARRRGISDPRSLGCRPVSFGRDLWPKSVGCGRCRTRAVARAPSTEMPAIGRVVTSLGQQPPGSSGIWAYLDLLERVLEDRVITEREAEALLQTALDWGLSTSDVVDAHRAYLAGLVRADLADDLISDAEMRDLRTVARLLALEGPTLDETLFGVMSGTDVDASLRQPVSTPSLSGMRVCFAGRLLGRLDGELITRDRAEALASAAGLTVTRSVTRVLDILVVADAATPSGTADRARELGVRIIAESAFWRDIGVQVE